MTMFALMIARRSGGRQDGGDASPHPARPKG
jgi:hypothetical protein